MNLSSRFCRTTAKLIVLLFLLCFSSSWKKKAFSNPDFPQTSEIERIYEEWLEKAKIYLISDTWKLKVDAIDRYECKVFRGERRTFCEQDGTPYFYKIDLLLEQPSQDKDGLRFWEDYNRQFYNNYGIELDDKLLFKASHLLGVPGYKVEIEIHAKCLSQIIRMNAEYQIYNQVGDECQMTPASTSIPAGSLQSNLTTRINSTQSKINLENTRTQIINFFENYYNSGNWKWINDNQNYIIFSIDGLKNEIVKRENLWEKIQVSIVFVETNNQLNLLLVIDGQIASGLGAAPPHRAYSDMEPEYSGELQDYANNLITQLQRNLRN